MELEEELTPADAVLLMSSAPEHIGDLVYGLDEARLRYRHGPAFPTLGGLISHMLESGARVDALLRRAQARGHPTTIRAVISALPVDRHRRSDDQLPHPARVFDQDLQEVRGAEGVDLGVAPHLVHALTHPDHRREVKDDIGHAQERTQRFRIADVTLYQAVVGVEIRRPFVCPAVDLAASADALHLRSNRLYEEYFLWKLKGRLRSKAKLFPGAFDTSRLRGIGTLRDFDDKITAYYCGFAGAADYYDRAAATHVVDRIAVPAFILHAANDPFIRILPETRKKILANPNITFLETEDGGHCSFLAQPDGDDGRWAESQIVEFLRKC